MNLLNLFINRGGGGVVRYGTSKKPEGVQDSPNTEVLISSNNSLPQTNTQILVSVISVKRKNNRIGEPLQCFSIVGHLSRLIDPDICRCLMSNHVHKLQKCRLSNWIRQHIHSHTCCETIHYSNQMLQNCWTNLVVGNICALDLSKHKLEFNEDSLSLYIHAHNSFQKLISRTAISCKGNRIQTDFAAPPQTVIQSALDCELATISSFCRCQNTAAPSISIVVPFLNFLSLSYPAQTG